MFHKVEAELHVPRRALAIEEIQLVEVIGQLGQAHGRTVVDGVDEVGRAERGGIVPCVWARGGRAWGAAFSIARWTDRAAGAHFFFHGVSGLGLLKARLYACGDIACSSFQSRSSTRNAPEVNILRSGSFAAARANRYHMS